MKDGIRHKLDITINKKFFKAFDLNNLLRLEVEFLMSADFMKLRADFTRVIMQPVNHQLHDSDKNRLDLETCI